MGPVFYACYPIGMTPEDFSKRLQRMVDPALTCYWNPMKRRYVIDRCTHPEASSGLHVCTLACRRTNVMIVEDKGHYRELADDLIGALIAMDAWKNYGSIDGMNAAEKRMEDERDANIEKQTDEAWKNIVADNKRQLRKAFDLIQTHDMSEVH